MELLRMEQVRVVNLLLFLHASSIWQELVECLLVNWLLVCCFHGIAQLLHDLILDAWVSAQVYTQKTLTDVDCLS